MIEICYIVGHGQNEREIKNNGMDVFIMTLAKCGEVVAVQALSSTHVRLLLRGDRPLSLDVRGDVRSMRRICHAVGAFIAYRRAHNLPLRLERGVEMPKTMPEGIVSAAQKFGKTALHQMFAVVLAGGHTPEHFATVIADWPVQRILQHQFVATASERIKSLTAA